MQEICQGALVGRRLPAEPADEATSFSVGNELLRIRIGQRRDPELGLSDQLGKDAAGPERNEWAEYRVLHDPGEELRAPFEHRLDDHGQPDSRRGLAHLVLVAEAEGDGAGFRLVRTRLR